MQYTHAHNTHVHMCTHGNARTAHMAYTCMCVYNTHVQYVHTHSFMVHPHICGTHTTHVHIVHTCTHTQAHTCTQCMHTWQVHTHCTHACSTCTRLHIHDDPHRGIYKSAALLLEGAVPPDLLFSCSAAPCVGLCGDLLPGPQPDTEP